MNEFEVAKPTGRCHATGRQIGSSERFFSALFEAKAGFERRDFSEEAWKGPPEGALCHFQTRLPKKEEPRRLFVDDGALLNLFLNLAGIEEESKRRFRFVLSLVLMRKRLLKYERTIHDASGESWEMRMVRDKSLHRVLSPALSDAEIEQLTGELGAIFSGGLDVGSSPEADSTDEPLEQIRDSKGHAP